MSGQTVTIHKMLPASCEEVFDAWLDPKGMQQWMRPGPVTSCEVILEPHVGGHFRIVMTAPNMKYVNTGEFRVLERPSRLEFTWVSPRWDFQETLVTIELFPRETRCELVLTHQRFPAGHSVPQLEKGWGEMLENLTSILRKI